MKKKLLCLLLTIAMVFSLTAYAFAGNDEDKVYHYLSLGGSNTTAFGLHGCLPETWYELSGEIDMSDSVAMGSKNAPEYSYPTLIKEYLEKKVSEQAVGYKGYTEVELKQYAMNSARVEELRFLLDEDFTSDEFTKWRFYGGSGTNWFGKSEEELATLRKEYKEAVEEADLITFEFGLNNFTNYVASRILGGSLSNDDFSNIVGEEYADQFYELRSQIHDEIDKLNIDGIDSTLCKQIESYTDTFAYALLGYIVNFDECMKIIRELNPTAKIVVESIENPIEGIKLTYNNVTIPLGDLVQAYIGLGNTYIATLSPYCTCYYYADLNQDGAMKTFRRQMLEYDWDYDAWVKGGQTSYNPWDESTWSMDASGKYKAEDSKWQDIRDCFDFYDTGFVNLKYYIAAKFVQKEISTPNDATETAIKNIADAYISQDAKIANLPSGLSLEKVAQMYDWCSSRDDFKLALTRAYHTYALLAKECLSNEDFDLKTIISEGINLDTWSDQFEQSIKDYIPTKALENTALNEATIVNDIYQTNIIGNSEVQKLVFALALRFSYYNCFFAHANRDGHAMAAEYIIDALENRITGPQIAAEKVIDFCKDVLETNEEQNELLNTNVVNNIATEKAQEIKEILIEGTEKLQEFTNGMKTLIQDVHNQMLNFWNKKLSK